MCAISHSLGRIVAVSLSFRGDTAEGDTATTTCHEYRQFARECAKWAVETDTDEDRKSFLALAKDFSVMATEHATENREAAR
jgi:hypothetical protein